MDFKQIQELIRMVNKSNIAELSIREGDFRITIRSTDYMAPQTIRPEMYNPVSMPMGQQQQSIPSANYSQPAQEAVGEQKEPAKTASGSDDSKYVTIKSPMIGTFYRTPGPDKPTFVNVGDEIQPGTVVCIIEAMKLFNEIESDIKGKIVKMLVENATPVEYDQPLFLVDPS